MKRINDYPYQFQQVADRKLPQPPLMYFMVFTTLNQEGIQEKPFSTLEELMDYVTTKSSSDSFDQSRAFFYGRRVSVTRSRMIKIGIEGRTIHLSDGPESKPQQQQ